MSDALSLAKWQVSWTLRNLFGNAERVQGNASLGHKTSNTFRLEASHPLLFGSPIRFNISAFQSNANLTKYSSFRERQRGLNVALTNVSDGESTHEVWYEAAWRTIALEQGTLVCPPEEAGDSFKSSLRHVYSYDTRGDPRLPESGVLLRNTVEVAGLGGDVKFLKNTLEVQQHAATNFGVTFALSGSLGILQVCTHTYVFACGVSCLYACMHVCVHVIMYLCTYVCMYIGV